jgi:uncharacterized protein
MGASKIELEIVALSHSVTQNHSYAVVLGEVNGVRRIPIVIGGFEAQAIAIALDKMVPGRPLTHDLMRTTMAAFDIMLEEVIIYKLEEGVFFSQLICSNENGRIEIDSRTSDAIALAVRFGASIYTNEEILLNAGLLMDEPRSGKSESNIIPTETPKSKNPYTKMSKSDLEEKLNEVLDMEDYIAAAAIRDELNRRK